LEENMKKLIVTLIVGTLLALPLSAMAMDAVTNAELDGVAGQSGVTIAFGGTSTTTIDFSELNWGDPDGMGAGSSASGAGWIVLQGEVTIDQEIADGETLQLDVATADAAGYASNAVAITGGVTFIAVTLPSITTTITVPDTFTVGLGTAAGTISGTIGLLNLADLDVSTGTPDVLYIYAH
jgi:hypothetical protein